MVAVPDVMPLTTPKGSTVAMLVAAELHTPPATASVSDVVEPAHTAIIPVMLPVAGSGPTVTIIPAAAVPQLLLTV